LGTENRLCKASKLWLDELEQEDDELENELLELELENELLLENEELELENELLEDENEELEHEELEEDEGCTTSISISENLSPSEPGICPPTETCILVSCAADFFTMNVEVITSQVSSTLKLSPESVPSELPEPSDQKVTWKRLSASKRFLPRV